MMKTLGSLIVLALIFTSPSKAQTAKVIALSAQDAAEAKSLYAQRDAINAKLTELQKKVTDKYLSDEKPGPGPSLTGYITSSCFLTLSGDGRPSCPPETAAQKSAREEREAKEKLQHHLERKDGWNAFEFSEDFKFVVPVVTKFTTSTPNWVGCNALTPAMSINDGHLYWRN